MAIGFAGGRRPTSPVAASVVVLEPRVRRGRLPWRLQLKALEDDRDGAPVGGPEDDGAEGT